MCIEDGSLVPTQGLRIILMGDSRKLDSVIRIQNFASYLVSFGHSRCINCSGTFSCSYCMLPADYEG